MPTEYSHIPFAIAHRIQGYKDTRIQGYKNKITLLYNYNSCKSEIKRYIVMRGGDFYKIMQLPQFE